MRSLSVAARLETLKIDSQQPWYLLLKITMPNATILRIVNNPDDVTFRSEVYTAFAFHVEDITEQTKGELPSVTIRVANATRTAQSILDANGGATGAVVNLYLVNAANLSGESDLEEEYMVMASQSSNEWVTFTLGAANPLRILFPRNRYTENYCRHVYNSPALQASGDPRGVMCAYTGALVSCDKTLNGPNGCRTHANVPRFGGYPGISAPGFKIASPI